PRRFRLRSARRRPGRNGRFACLRRNGKCRAYALRYGHDDVDLPDLGDGGLQIADDDAVVTLDDRPGIQRLDAMQGIVEVTEIAVEELRRIRAVGHDDALREERRI